MHAWVCVCFGYIYTYTYIYIYREREPKHVADLYVNKAVFGQ